MPRGSRIAVTFTGDESRRSPKRAELRDRLVGHPIGDVRGRFLKIQTFDTGRRVGLCHVPPMQVHHEHGHIRGRHARDPRSLAKRARSESAELVSGLHRDALQPLIVERTGDHSRLRCPMPGDLGHLALDVAVVLRADGQLLDHLRRQSRPDCSRSPGSSMRSRSAKVTCGRRSTWVAF